MRSFYYIKKKDLKKNCTAFYDVMSLYYLYIYIYIICDEEREEEEVGGYIGFGIYCAGKVSRCFLVAMLRTWREGRERIPRCIALPTVNKTRQCPREEEDALSRYNTFVLVNDPLVHVVLCAKYIHKISRTRDYVCVGRHGRSYVY